MHAVTSKAPDAPRRRGPSAWRRLTAPVVVGAAASVGTAVLALRTPHALGAYGICPSLLVTGTYCAACGGLRAVHELTQGDVVGAWAFNQAVVAAVPVAVVLWFLWVRAAARGRRLRTGPAWLPVAVLVAAVVYGALRNVPILVPLLAPGGVAPPILG